MPIPDAQLAFVPVPKLDRYLLNLTHPVGGPKARWFISFGYNPRERHRLEADLLRIAQTCREYVEETNADGVKYIADGVIETPRRRRAHLRTVWIREPDSPGPRFVTAYPIREAAHEGT